MITTSEADPLEAVCSVHLSFSLQINSANNWSMFIIPAGLEAGESVHSQAIVLPSDEGGNLFACRREAPGVRDIVTNKSMLENGGP